MPEKRGYQAQVKIVHKEYSFSPSSVLLYRGNFLAVLVKGRFQTNQKPRASVSATRSYVYGGNLPWLNKNPAEVYDQLQSFLTLSLHLKFDRSSLICRSTNQNMAPKNRGNYVKYQKLSNDEGYIDAQFIKPVPRVPWRAICLAVFLFSVGTVALVMGSLLFTGYFDVKYADRTYPLLILGSIMFIPGFYHVRLAYYAWKGYRGYSFEDIPDFD